MSKYKIRGREGGKGKGEGSGEERRERGVGQEEGEGGRGVCVCGIRANLPIFRCSLCSSGNYVG